MNVVKDLLKFLESQPAVAVISTIAEGVVSELSDPENGMIWFGRSGTSRLRTFEQATGPAEEQLFDIEIFHPDADVVDSVADALQNLDGYRGAFGDGDVQAFFVDDQSDDYVPRSPFSDTTFYIAAFLRIEIRCYTPPAPTP